ncbi:MAG: DUF507 family protein [Proteobacteria bacterium]|nr:DUF507 family protein [Pseudomonadota bacterium]
MKLFPGKVDIIAAELAHSLAAEEAIEATDIKEVEMDIAAVFKEYIRVDRELTDQAKDLCEKRSLPYSAFPKIKRQLADKLMFRMGEDALDYIMEQLLGCFMHSQFVEEVFAEDHEIKVIMRPIIRKHTEIEDNIDEETRQRIKNLKEGTAEWDIEYQRAKAQVMKRRQLT